MVHHKQTNQSKDTVSYCPITCKPSKILNGNPRHELARATELKSTSRISCRADTPIEQELQFVLYKHNRIVILQC